VWPFSISKKRRMEHEHRQAEVRRQRILFLIEKAEKHELTDEENNELRRANARFLTSSERTRFETAIVLASALSEYDKDRRSLKSAIDDVDRAENLDQRVFALASLVGTCDEVNKLNRPLLEKEFNHRPETLLAELKQLAHDRYQELLAVWTESPVQLEALRQFVVETHMGRDRWGRKRPNRLRAVGIEPLAYPADWNKFVALLYATPELERFIGRSLNYNEVLLLAEEARRLPDADEAFTNAQLVLAYCRASHEYRQHVGDILVTELAQIVNTYRFNQFNTAKRTAETDTAEVE
jgi:flagellar biosynthesis/type III secretory pathway chaperone